MPSAMVVGNHMDSKKSVSMSIAKPATSRAMMATNRNVMALLI
jgi:hypothetical protein